MGDIGPTQQRYEVLPAEPVTPAPVVEPLAEPVIVSGPEAVVGREPGRARV